VVNFRKNSSATGVCGTSLLGRRGGEKVKPTVLVLSADLSLSSIYRDPQTPMPSRRKTSWNVLPRVTDKQVICM
jgi:hypothetical protein